MLELHWHKISKNVKALVSKGSSRHEYHNNAINNILIGLKNGHVVTAVLSRAQLWHSEWSLLSSYICTKIVQIGPRIVLHTQKKFSFFQVVVFLTKYFKSAQWRIQDLGGLGSPLRHFRNTVCSIIVDSRLNVCVMDPDQNYLLGPGSDPLFYRKLLKNS